MAPKLVALEDCGKEVTMDEWYGGRLTGGGRTKRIIATFKAPNGNVLTILEGADEKKAGEAVKAFMEANQAKGDGDE